MTLVSNKGSDLSHPVRQPRRGVRHHPGDVDVRELRFQFAHTSGSMTLRLTSRHALLERRPDLFHRQVWLRPIPAGAHPLRDCVDRARTPGARYDERSITLQMIQTSKDRFHRGLRNPTSMKVF